MSVIFDNSLLDLHRIILFMCNKVKFGICKLCYNLVKDKIVIWKGC